MGKKIVTSVTIHPEDKKKADELHINYSEAFEKGLKWMILVKGKGYEREMKLKEQEKKVRKLKNQMKLKEDISNTLEEIKAEYAEIAHLAAIDPTDKQTNEILNEYINELIKLKSMNLEIPPEHLKTLLHQLLSARTYNTSFENFKGKDVLIKSLKVFEKTSK